MRKEKTFKLGKNAQKILLYTLPLLVFAAFALTLYVALPDSTALVREKETVLLFLETISRSCVCVALATVLTDYAERKRA